MKSERTPAARPRISGGAITWINAYWVAEKLAEAKPSISSTATAVPFGYRIARADPEEVAAFVARAEAADLVRGYEGIKLRNVAAFRAKATELLGQLDAKAAKAADTRQVGAGAA